MERRYDIDRLRVIAIGLLLIYHIAIVFQPWAVFFGFMQNAKSLESLFLPMNMLNIWRIPLLFYVSGMGVAFALRRRNIKQLIAERSRRILLPFIFGMLVIVPLHVFLWQKYYHQDLTYAPNPGHLWFLGNIFAYVVLLSPIFYLQKKYKTNVKKLTSLFHTPLGLVPIILIFCIEAVLLKPEPFEYYAMNLHGFLIGFIAFFTGYIFVRAGEKCWEMLIRYRFLFLVIAIALFIVRMFVNREGNLLFLTTIESNLWIFSAFGFARKHFNKGSALIRYLSKAAYPVYIIHMLWLYLGSYYILPMHINTWLKFVLLNLITFAGTMLMYELLIRRIRFVRFLFGLK